MAAHSFPLACLPAQARPAAMLGAVLVSALPGRGWPFSGRKLLIVAVVLLETVGLLLHYNVSNELTVEDRQYIQLFLPGVPEGCAAQASYAEQISLIQRAQRALAARTRAWQGIPAGQPREPKQLYLAQSGLCYDRSRTLEKMLRYLGLPARHLFLLTREPGVPPYRTFFLHRVPSHAVSEVKTREGWLVADSNDLWLSLDAQGHPISAPQLQRCGGQLPIRWLTPVVARNAPFYEARCIAIYGLYSRHGGFYPPYTVNIPDFRVQELLHNVAAD